MSPQVIQDNDSFTLSSDWQKLQDREFYILTAKPKSDAKAVIVVVHGFGEHVDRYHHVFSAFANAGYAVHGFDQRGFGKTGKRQGPLGHSESWAVVLDDISAVIKQARVPARPLFLFGHSMGGLRVLEFMADRGEQENIAGFISSAPALQADPSYAPGWLKFNALSAVGTLLPTFPMSTNIDAEKLSRDSKVAEEYKASPYNYDIGTLQTLKDLIKGGKRLLGPRANQIQAPLLLAHGDADVVTSPKASEQCFQLIGSQDKTLKIWPGFYHELHNEPEKEQVLQHYVDWLNNHVKS